MLFCKILYINKIFLVVFVDHSAALPRSRRCLKCAPSQDLEEAGQRGGADYAMGKALGRTERSLGRVQSSFLGSFTALSVLAAYDLRHSAAFFLYL